MLRFFRPNPTELTDRDLLDRFRRTGNSDWLGKLYERYMELTYGICLKYFQDEGLAEDAVMAIFESLLVKVPEHDIQNFKSWLYTFARNHCLMELRREKTRPNLQLESEFMQFEQFGHLLEEYSENGHLRHLEDCMHDLMPQQRSCIKLFYYEGKTYKEIAEMKCDEIGKIRSYIQNGRRNLRICLEQKEAKAKHLE